MKKIIYLFLIFGLNSNGQTQIGNTIDGFGANGERGPSVSISSNGDTVAVGSWESDVNGSDSGQVNIYEFTNNNWVQIGNAINGEAPNDNFGVSVSLSDNGNIVAIGAPNHSGSSDFGQVKIFALNSGNWVQLGDDITGNASNNFFGASLSLSADGSILAIGSPGFSANDYGQVKIYIYMGGGWSQLGNAIDGTNFDNFFGNNLKLSSDGSTLAVSDFNYDGDANQVGKTKVYSFTNNNWTQKGSPIFNTLSADNLPLSVSISATGDFLAIGVPGHDGVGIDSGKAKVYQYVNNDWVQLGSDINGNTSDSHFGSQVNLGSNNDVLIVSASKYNNVGKVDVFKLENNTWSQIGNSLLGTGQNDFFGFSMVLSENNIIAISSGNTGTAPGEIKVYDLSNLLTVLNFKKKKFKIYPNPVSDILHFENSENTIFSEIIIYDISGRIVQYVKNKNLHSIKVDNLKAGTYFLEVNNKNKGFVEKFIVD